VSAQALAQVFPNSSSQWNAVLFLNCVAIVGCVRPMHSPLARDPRSEMEAIRPKNGSYSPLVPVNTLEKSMAEHCFRMRAHSLAVCWGSFGRSFWVSVESVPSACPLLLQPTKQIGTLICMSRNYLQIRWVFPVQVFFPVHPDHYFAILLVLCEQHDQRTRSSTVLHQ
jgi:hypothetical protein